MPREFTGATMRQALDQVREACGVDAMILSQSETRKGVTIVVAEPHVEVPLTSETDSRASDERPRLNPDSTVGAPPSEPSHSRQRPNPAGDPRSARASELRFAALDPAWSRRLAELGFTEAFLADLDGCIESETQLHQAVLARVPVESMDAARTGSWRVLGAPGVGKTTTAIKLLAARVLAVGPAGSRVVSADTQRLGGQESLLLASELLGLELHSVAPAALAGCIGQAQAGELEVIDTPGVALGHGRPAVARPAPGVRDVFVLPATWRSDVAGQWLDAQGTRSSCCAVITHVDEAPAIGGLCSELAVRGIPLLALGTGTSLPEALEPASAALLTQLMFRGQTRIADYA